MFGALAALFFWWSITAGLWNGFVFTPFVNLDVTYQVAILVVLAIVLWFIYMKLRNIAGRGVLKKLEKDDSLGPDREPLARAFAHNMKAWWRSIASVRPRGWSGRRRKQLHAVMADADSFVQSLNDRYATPSGQKK